MLFFNTDKRLRLSVFLYLHITNNTTRMMSLYYKT